MAANLQKQIRQLEELSRLQRRFVSDVSHELRTPLTTVRMASDVLHDARGRFDPATARAAELLQTELDRFETLLADLLEISRFDAGRRRARARGRQPRRRRPPGGRHDLARWPTSATPGCVVDGPDEPCLAEADVRRVERIVRNLVTNAIDHAESRDVEILVAGDDHAAAIAVRDHGVGLGPGESAMVFNRFWRADPARARTSGGTGLGLSISLEDAQLHGGWLQAWGRPGEGAQFRLTLPRHAGHPAAAQPAAAGARRRPGDRDEDPPHSHAALAGLRPHGPAASQMPTAGPVVESQVSTEVDDAPGISFDPRPPRPGSPRSEIVARLPRGDEGDPHPHDGRSPVPLPGRPGRVDAGGADHHLRRDRRPRRRHLVPSRLR